MPPIEIQDDPRVIAVLKKIARVERVRYVVGYTEGDDPKEIRQDGYLVTANGNYTFEDERGQSHLVPPNRVEAELASGNAKAAKAGA